MSWRRFRVLVAGLGPQTALVAHIANKQPASGKSVASNRQSPDAILDYERHPEQINDLFRAMTGRKGRAQRTPRAAETGTT